MPKSYKHNNKQIRTKRKQIEKMYTRNRRNVNENPVVVFGSTPFCFLGGAPSPGNTTNHNHSTAVTGGTVAGSGVSNFKRQNTVDAATIKENTARAARESARPTATKNSPGQLDTSEFISHSNNHFFQDPPVSIRDTAPKEYHTKTSFVLHRFKASIRAFVLEFVAVI
jgi:hypothetical protein